MEENYTTTVDPALPATAEAANTPWDQDLLVAADFHVLIYRDKHPVTPGHLLFVPRHNTTHILSEAFNEAFRYGRHRVNIGEWDGFNIGLNYGKAAGQTVAWPHIHLIPRYEGDVANPIGGVRNLLGNGLGDYQTQAQLDPYGGN